MQNKIIGFLLLSVVLAPVSVSFAQEQSIPAWIKNNAGLWYEGLIDDATFVSGIEFLIEQKIMQVSETSKVPEAEKKIPAWIKNNAGLWYEGLIDDATFVSGIEFLVKDGIIQVNYDRYAGVDIPKIFDEMIDAEPERIFYVAINDDRAKNSNNGLTVDEPFKDLSAFGKIKIKSGDTIMLREGTYTIPKQGISLDLEGKSNKPIRVSAYQNEKVILDQKATRQDYEDALKNSAGSGEHLDPLMRIGGKYLIVEGMEFTGCLETCILYKGNYVILKNNIFKGSIEELIKTTSISSDALFIGNNFSGFMNEAIDIFGAHRVYVVDNEFHDNDISLRDPSTVIWAKAGAKDIYYLNNNFSNLVSKSHAIMLGGCCWSNWDGKNPDGTPKHVAENAHAIGNTISNVELMSNYKWRGTITVEGCKNCSVKNNSVDNIPVVFSIKPTEKDGIILHSINTEINENTITNITTNRILNIQQGSIQGFQMKDNVYHGDKNMEINFGGDMITLKELQDREFDVGSKIIEVN